MLTDVGLKGYRSIRKLHLPLRRLTVLTGGNGVGKTNLYRALELLHAAAVGTLAGEIAGEGGLGSIFWAGGKNLTDDGRYDPQYRASGYGKSEAPRLELEARLDLGDFHPTYRVEIAFADWRFGAAFPGEAAIRTETLELSEKGRPVLLMRRHNMALEARGSDGRMALLDIKPLPSETALSTIRESRPEIAIVQNELRNWRFFHGFRTDRDSSLRRPCHAVTAPLLASDGSNLPAVFATLRHIRGETVDLDAAIAAAFPGARLEVPLPEGQARFGMVFPETPARTFMQNELSDGTLQFLALLGALLSYRLPPFIALNEPEASLHPSLLPALAATIVKAAERTQIWVVTHSEPLATAIADMSGIRPREVLRNEDGTHVRGISPLGIERDD